MKKPPWRPLHLLGVATCFIGSHMFTHFPHSIQKYTGTNLIPKVQPDPEIDPTGVNPTRPKFQKERSECFRRELDALIPLRFIGSFHSRISAQVACVSRLLTEIMDDRSPNAS